MRIEEIERLINSNIIKKQYEGEYRLVRPLKIIIKRSVLDSLSKIYKPSYEEGGLLESKAIGGGTLIVDFFHLVKNKSILSYSYSPNAKEFQNKIDDIIGRGNLPFAIHTHPIKLGIDTYDNNRAKFFIRPSKADKYIARDGITPYFNFPEVIYTKDVRLNNGFGLSFFTGFIFPASNVGISVSSWLFLGSGILGLAIKNKSLTFLSGIAILLDLFRRPNYKLLASGDMEISLSN